jgi:UDP-N-acetylglucosamine--N-acetylmuramyl-(pentapeptide) pyrophosphoryl-undecaprenol N-acetylglucosamine transferase
MGLAAAALKIPYITHDSDIVPGLANRIISRWARWHAVSMPKEHYSYPAGATIETGVPLSDNYKMVTATLQREYKASFGLPADAQVVCVTGGGLGAQRLNIAMASIAKKLLARYPKAVILHVSGRNKEDELVATYQKTLKPDDLARIVLEPFVEDLYRYSGAADVIVARGGASSLAEFAAQAKACIVVANPQLTGGHQTKNAAVLEDLGAVVSLKDEAVTKNPELLLQQIEALLNAPQKRLALARNLHTTAHSDAAEQLAKLVIQTANERAKA